VRPAVTRRILLSLLGLGLATGCGPDFDPYNRLTGLRVLAIQSDPAAPGPGETTTLTPLVFTPEPGAAVTYAWSWCPFPGEASAGYPCQVTREQLMMMTGGAVNVPSFDLGAGPTAMLAHTIDPMVLRALCGGQPGVPQIADCEGGFPVQVRVKVASAGDEVDTVYTLRLRIDSPPNANPKIDGLAAVIEAMDRPIGAEPVVTLTRNKETAIKTLVSEAQSETYPGKNDDGQPDPNARERLFVSWFVEGGDTKDEVTGYIPGRTELKVLQENKWSAPKTKDYAKDTARLYVVLRDNRGGVSWTSGIVRLAGEP
jgi:hypothetical protein